MIKNCMVAFLILCIIFFVGCKSDVSKKEVRILNSAEFLIEDNPYLKKTIDVFTKKHSSVDVKLIQIDNYFKKLNEKLEQKDDSFDIFIVDNKQQCIITRLSETENLMGYTNLTPYFDKMFYGLTKLCSLDNIIYGIPASLDVYAFLANTDAFLDSNIAIPKSQWTWDEFFDTAIKIRTDRDNADTSNIFLYGDEPVNLLKTIIKSSDIIYIDYNNCTIKYNNSNFIDILKKVKMLYANKYIAYNPDVEDQFLWNLSEFNQGRRLLISGSLNLEKHEHNGHEALHDENMEKDEHQNVDKYATVLIPGINVNNSYPPTLGMFCINKYSKNKKLAADFLEAVLSEEVQKDLTYAPIYKNSDIYDNSSRIQEKSVSKQEAIRLYEYILDNTDSQVITAEMYDVINANFLEYFNDNISVEEAVQNIDKGITDIVNNLTCRWNE